MRPPEYGAAHYPYVGDDPASVATVEVTLDRASRDLAVLGAAMTGAVPRLRSAWPSGADGDAAVHDVGVTAGFVRSTPPALRASAWGLGSYADRLVAERGRVDDLNAAHAVLAPAERRLAGLPYPPTAADVTAYDAAETDLAIARATTGFASTVDLDAAYAALVGRVVGHRDDCAGRLRATTPGAPRGSVVGASAYAAGLTLLARGGLAGALSRAGLREVPSGAEEVKAFWSGLTSAEREAILDHDPRRFGALEGLPVVDRDHANRRALEQDRADGVTLLGGAGLPAPTTVAALDAQLAALTPAQLVALGAVPAAGLGVPLLLPSVVRRLGALRNALATGATLATASDSLLLLYDGHAYPKGGVPEGRAAVAFGDPDTADNVAVCVPGLESRVAKLDQVGGDALGLRDQAARADPGRHTAVVAWQGYDAPEVPWSGVPGLGVLGEARAEAGAALLADAVHGLRVSHEGDGAAGAAGAPVVTVVGHSYGSTTTGLALQHHGLARDVDQVALIGSCGVGGTAQSVGDLGLRDDQLFVGTASHDVINQTSDTLLGRNPLDPDFGGTRFRAESPDRGDSPFGVADHSRYYSDAHGGSESLFSLGEIASGHGDRLAADAMVAEKPNEPHVLQPFDPVVDRHLVPGRPPYVDPEAQRVPTGGHR